MFIYLSHVDKLPALGPLRPEIHQEGKISTKLQALFRVVLFEVHVGHDAAPVYFELFKVMQAYTDLKT